MEDKNTEKLEEQDYNLKAVEDESLKLLYQSRLDKKLIILTI